MGLKSSPAQLDRTDAIREPRPSRSPHVATRRARSYKVEGNTLTMTYSGSWKQSWTGTTQKRQIEIVGNQLTLMSAPFKSAQTGQDTVFVVTYERAD